MTTSPAKSAANRANGMMSAGPKTPEGKLRSSANALKHGLCSRRLVIPGENAEEFSDFRARFWADLKPCGAVEQFLVERIVSCAWRLRRAVRIENEVIERAGNAWRMGNQARMTFELRRGGTTTMLGMSFEAAPPATLDSLARHEVRLERSLARALHELQRIRANVVPYAIDVDGAGLPHSDDSDGVDPDLQAELFDAESVTPTEQGGLDQGPPTFAELCSPERGPCQTTRS